MVLTSFLSAGTFHLGNQMLHLGLQAAPEADHLRAPRSFGTCVSHRGHSRYREDQKHSASSIACAHCSTVHCSTVHCSTVHCSTVHCNTVQTCLQFLQAALQVTDVLQLAHA